MADREKVIKGLEVCTSKPCYCTDCPYKANCSLDSQEVMQDALVMLKEQQEEIENLKQTAQSMMEGICLLKEQQEEVPVIQREIMHMLVYCCGSCGVAITDGDKFCRMCGKKVKWNAID